MNRAIVLVPIYKEVLTPQEEFSLKYSLESLAGREVVFIGPEILGRSYYKEHFGGIPFVGFRAPFFESIPEYNRLLLSPAFYARFDEYEFMLILQTDAIVLRDELDYWCGQPFDYVGAPWPEGYELFVNAGLFQGENGKRVKVQVGNGGFSLRRIQKCKSLLNEFTVAVDVFDKTGSSEDLFFSVMGALSVDFIIPNEITASRFSLELRPSYYFRVNGARAPMAGHAWWLYEPDFWKPLLRSQPLIHQNWNESTTAVD